MPSGSRCSYFHSLAPVFASSAKIREYDAVTNILPLWISGCDSWPRCFSPPNENDQAGTRRATFFVLILASGEKRWPSGPIPHDSTSPGLFASFSIIASVTAARAAKLATQAVASTSTFNLLIVCSSLFLSIIGFDHLCCGFPGGPSVGAARADRQCRAGAPNRKSRATPAVKNSRCWRAISRRDRLRRCAVPGRIALPRNNRCRGMEHLLAEPGTGAHGANASRSYAGYRCVTLRRYSAGIAAHSE